METKDISSPVVPPELPFTVRAWAAWGEAAVPAEAGAPPLSVDPARDPAPAPVLLRRRVSALGQHALRLAWSMACSGEARLIASSRHGEFGRSLGIMQALVGGEPVSPSDFMLSVHHAVIGLLAIARGNRAGHTAVAAGPESFCCGFLEAVACLAETPAQPVLLVHYDEALPPPFSGAAPAWPAVALVVVLAADGPGEAMAFAARPATTLAGEPADPAARFRDFLANPAASSLAIAGERMKWNWRRAGVRLVDSNDAAA